MLRGKDRAEQLARPHAAKAANLHDRTETDARLVYIHEVALFCNMLISRMLWTGPFCMTRCRSFPCRCVSLRFVASVWAPVLASWGWTRASGWRLLLRAYRPRRSFSDGGDHDPLVGFGCRVFCFVVGMCGAFSSCGPLLALSCCFVLCLCFTLFWVLGMLGQCIPQGGPWDGAGLPQGSTTWGASALVFARVFAFPILGSSAPVEIWFQSRAFLT